MIKTIKHIISVYAVTSLLALSFIGCAQPTTPEVKYKVTFDENGHGTKPDTIEVKENTVLTAEQLKPLDNIDGLGFNGWFDGTTKAEAGVYKVTKAVTLKADWSDIAPNEVTDLKFTNGGGVFSVSWKEPQDIDFAKVIISYANTTLDVLKGTSTQEIKGLETGKTYPIKVQTVDEKGHTSTGISIDAVYNPFNLTVEPIKYGTKIMNGKTFDLVKFGDYPQTLLNPSKVNEIIPNAESATPIKVNAMDCYIGTDGNLYVKEVAIEKAPNQQYTNQADDGTIFETGKTYYFKVEPIEWRVLTNDFNGKKLLFAEKALEVRIFGSRLFNISEIRAYLNGTDGNTEYAESFIGKGFIDKAFTPSAIAKIAETNVDNSFESNFMVGEELKQGSSYEGQLYDKSIFECDNTIDKIFLLSCNQISQQDYGFTTIDGKIGQYSVKFVTNAQKEATDLARGMGVMLALSENKYTNNNCFYWLKSPDVRLSMGIPIRVISNKEDSYDEVDCSFDKIGVAPALCLNN